MGNGVRHSQRHQLGRDQVEGPPPAPFRGITAGNPRRLGFHPTIERTRSPAAGRVVQHLPQGATSLGLVFHAQVVDRPSREA